MIRLSEFKRHFRRAMQSAVLYGVFATTVRVGANLLLLPLLLARMTSPELALWYVFLALGNFANLADFGFGTAISRVYSYLWAGAEDFDAEGLRPPPRSCEPNVVRISQLTATVRDFYLKLSLFATLLLAVAGSVILIKPAAAVHSPYWVWGAWAAYLATIGYNLATGWWMLACSGMGRVRELQVAYTWSSLAYVACAAFLLIKGWGLMSVVLASALRGVILREYCRRVYLRAIPGMSAGEAERDPAILKRLWPNASKFGLISIGAFLIANASVLISSHFLDAQTTASFGVTQQIGTFLMNFAALWLGVKWPHLTMLRTQGRLQEMAVLFARRLAFTMATFFVSAILVILVGNRILEFKGSHTHLLETPALIFYFAYLSQQLLYVQFGSLAYTENVVPFFHVSMFTGFWLVILSFILTRLFGFWGMLVAPLIAESTWSSWFTIRRGFSGQPLAVRQFFRAAIEGHT